MLKIVPLKECRVNVFTGLPASSTAARSEAAIDCLLSGLRSCEKSPPRNTVPLGVRVMVRTVAQLSVGLFGQAFHGDHDACGVAETDAAFAPHAVVAMKR